MEVRGVELTGSRATEAGRRRTSRCSRLLPVLELAERAWGRAILMKSEEARIGKRVRVVEDHGTPHLRKQEGTVVKRWGNPGYAALDV
jgi:hypothetical protein